MEDVADDCAGRAGDDADAAREAGQGAFAGGVEDAFGGEFGFEFFECGLKGAGADGFDGLDDELILAAGLVDFDAAADEDFGTVPGLVLQKAVRAFPAGGAEGGAAVLKSEISMAGSGEF